MTLPRTAAVVVLAVVCTLGLAGCGSSSSTGSSSTGSSSTGSASDHSSGSGSKQASSGGGQAAKAQSLKVCSVLNAAQAAQASALALTAAVEQDDATQGIRRCAYSNADDTNQVQVTVFYKNANSTWQMIVGGKNLTSEPGLGDKAVYDGAGSLYALDGAALVQVNGIDDAAHCAALAKPVLAAL